MTDTSAALKKLADQLEAQVTVASNLLVDRNSRTQLAGVGKLGELCHAADHLIFAVTSFRAVSDAVIKAEKREARQ